VSRLSAETVIRVEGLCTRFGEQVIHDDLSLEVHRGEVFGVVGGSGSGKSVLLRAALGLLRPERGRIEVLGHAIAKLGDQESDALRARQGVSCFRTARC
jgi:phospholipid/cholesterol/gamma-HCH transport system ATP-binding protein